MTEYFLAILAVQSPLRHSVTFWPRGRARCHHSAKNPSYENVPYRTHAGLHAAIILDRFFPHMAKDDFAEVQRKLEAIASELKTANDPDR